MSDLKKKNNEFDKIIDQELGQNHKQKIKARQEGHIFVVEGVKGFKKAKNSSSKPKPFKKTEPIKEQKHPENCQGSCCVKKTEPSIKKEVVVIKEEVKEEKHPVSCNGTCCKKEPLAPIKEEMVVYTSPLPTEAKEVVESDKIKEQLPCPASCQNQCCKVIEVKEVKLEAKEEVKEEKHPVSCNGTCCKKEPLAPIKEEMVVYTSPLPTEAKEVVESNKIKEQLPCPANCQNQCCKVVEIKEVKLEAKEEVKEEKHPVSCNGTCCKKEPLAPIKEEMVVYTSPLPTEAKKVVESNKIKEQLPCPANCQNQCCKVIEVKEVKSEAKEEVKEEKHPENCQGTCCDPKETIIIKEEKEILNNHSDRNYGLLNLVWTLRKNHEQEIEAKKPKYEIADKWLVSFLIVLLLVALIVISLFLIFHFI